MSHAHLPVEGLSEGRRTESVGLAVECKDNDDQDVGQHGKEFIVLELRHEDLDLCLQCLCECEEQSSEEYLDWMPLPLTSCMILRKESHFSKTA